MVPKNIQSSLLYALNMLEEEYGAIDGYVSTEVGVGSETLADKFSVEQIDAVALIIRRVSSGRGFILGDETGIGKRSEEHTSELQSLMRNSYAVFCLKKKKKSKQ